MLKRRVYNVLGKVTCMQHVVRLPVKTSKKLHQINDGILFTWEMTAVARDDECEYILSRLMIIR